MIRQSLNDNWSVTKGSATIMDLFQGAESTGRPVTLPHDAMILEERREDTANGNQTGFYPGGFYTYVKNMHVPEAWQGNRVALEFEGVAGISRVYVNGEYAGGSSNGYRGFLVPAERFLQFGRENEIKVEVNQPEQSSRWYSGSGIYRDVHVWVGGPLRIEAEGLRISTPEVAEDVSAVLVETKLVNQGLTRQKVWIRTELLDERGCVAGYDEVPVTAYGQDSFGVRQRICVEKPLLWDAEHPHLYTCRVQVVAGEKVLDEARADFGIRCLSLSPWAGLRVNGREVKLRGTCIHHDNGIIGAVTLKAAEERRCLQLKEAGFNCIRSAHHPMSRAMLEACDRIGMYVMDELWDMWTRTKNPNDYANAFPLEWEEDVRRMVAKDYNHPSVILYSLGNEIPEAGTPGGAMWNRRINGKLKELDATRYTTNAVNGLLAGSARMGEILAGAMGLSPEELAQRMVGAMAAGDSQEAGQAGADALNSMAGMLMGPLADAVATSPILGEMMEEFVSATDIAGYNYLTALHEEEGRRHPNRVVLGTETFPADIVRLWEVVKNNPHVIGDMTWTGYDYLGEAGCGIFHYDGGQNFTSHWPDLLAGIGDIDITGCRKPISYLREIVYGLRKKPYAAVLRMDRDSRHAGKTPWMWKDNVAGWTWPGQEGKTASVDVYGIGEEAELFLNGRSLGRKALEGYVAVFEVPYEPGRLTAVNYEGGEKLGEFTLETAGSVCALVVEADKEELAADGADLCYIKIQLTDAMGRHNHLEEKQVTIAVEGAGTLQGFGSADPQARVSYQALCQTTYDGVLLAAVRAGDTPGQITVRFTAPGCGEETVLIQVRRRDFCFRAIAQRFI